MSTPDPGILFVPSRIKNPALSPEAFHKWYNEAHVPDVFQLGVSDACFRYESTTPSQVKYPYLAIWRVPSVGAIKEDTFANVPLTHDLLPGPIMEYGEFDTNFTPFVKQFERDGVGKGPATFVTTLLFTPPVEQRGAAAWIENTYLPGLKENSSFRRIRLYNIPKGSPAASVGSLLVLLEFDDEQAGIQMDIAGAQSATYKLVSVIGDANADFTAGS